MDIKTGKIVAYCLVIVLFVVGLVCYTAFSQNKPEDPIRIMLKSTAGNVLFDHKEHVSEDGYGIDCEDCHHEYDEEDEETKPEACGECHLAEMDEDEDDEGPKRMDAFHFQCNGCHEETDAPLDCAQCHVL